MNELGNSFKEALTIIFQNLCLKGDLDAIKEHLNKKEHGDIYYNENFAFHLLMNKRHIHVIEYLILDYKIERTPSLDKLLDDYPGDIPEQVKNIFKIREVNELSAELPVNVEVGKRPKV